jgi:hypothetical protein
VGVGVPEEPEESAEDDDCSGMIELELELEEELELAPSSKNSGSPEEDSSKGCAPPSNTDPLARAVAKDSRFPPAVCCGGPDAAPLDPELFFPTSGAFGLYDFLPAPDRDTGFPFLDDFFFIAGKN